MTHEQTWLTIAESYDMPPGERTEGHRELASSGLCAAASKLGLDSDLMCDMMERLGPEDYWWPTRSAVSGCNCIYCCQNRKLHKPKHDQYRSTMACFFLAMGKKEFEQLLEPVK